MNGLSEIISSYGHCNESGKECQYNNRGELHFFRKGDGCPGTVPAECLLFGRSRRLGDGPKSKEAVYKRASVVFQTADEDALSCVFIRKHSECIRYLLYTASFGLEPSPKRRDFPESRQTTGFSAEHPSVPHLPLLFLNQIRHTLHPDHQSRSIMQQR